MVRHDAQTHRLGPDKQKIERTPRQSPQSDVHIQDYIHNTLNNKVDKPRKMRPKTCRRAEQTYGRGAKHHLTKCAPRLQSGQATIRCGFYWNTLGSEVVPAITHRCNQRGLKHQNQMKQLNASPLCQQQKMQMENVKKHKNQANWALAITATYRRTPGLRTPASPFAGAPRTPGSARH